SSTDPLYAFDPEIEKTLRRLRRTKSLIVNNSRSSDSVINSNQFCIDNSVASSNIFAKPGQMENNDRTLKELATLDVEKTPQASEGIPCGLLHNEAVGDIERLHQNEDVPILPGWSCERLLLGLRPSERKYEGFGKTQEKLYMSTGSDSINFAPPVHTIRSYFYEGLSMMDRSMIDAASGGALMDKTPAAARHLISNMASNTQQFGIRGPNQ
ncbi:hypothetical protein CR513_49806, partial [Mucuna pruriens]